MDRWHRDEADADVTVLGILTQDYFYEEPDGEDAAAWRDNLDLGFAALAADAAWVEAWGGTRAPHHTYAVIDAEGVITWRLADGSEATVEGIAAAVADAE